MLLILVMGPVLLLILVMGLMKSYMYISSSPSVLDRLNPLLEPKGVLTIDERGVVEGNVTAVVPHPNFRSVCLSICMYDVYTISKYDIKLIVNLYVFF